jgi:hypothetical protein
VNIVHQPPNLLLSSEALIPTVGRLCFVSHPVMIFERIMTVVSNNLERERTTDLIGAF